MAHNGSANNIDSSRTEALQGLLASLGYATGDSSSPDARLSPEQLRKLSEKVDEILGNGGDHGVAQVPEPGQLLNEEGLQIVDITEPVFQDSYTDAIPATASEVDSVPMSLLPPDERERRRRERDRILDLLEDEERLQQLQEERDRVEERKEAIRKRKESAKSELQQLKAVKEMHKKMGKALVLDSRGGAEANIPNENSPPNSQPSSRTTRKMVSFADAPEVEEKEKQTSKRQMDWGDVAAGRLRASSRVPLVSTAEAEQYPMKMHVVERFPFATPTPISLSGTDSDDESASSSGRPPPQIANYTSDEDNRSSSSDADSSDQEPMEEEFDYESAQHQREVALEYYKRRHAIGAETAKAMATHALDDYEPDENVQSDGQLPLSRFRATRMAATYDTSHSPASTSIGPSVVPASRQKSLRNSVRLGKLESGQLVGGESGESGSEDETVREVLQMLKTGGIQNAGPDFDPSSLASAPPPSTVVVESPLVGPSTPAPNPKPSTFKLSQGGGSARTNSVQNHQNVDDVDKTQWKPAVSGVIERKAPRSQPSQHFPLNPSVRRPPAKAHEPAFSMVVDSPSFPMPTGAPPASNVVVSSSSFPALSDIVESPSFPQKQSDLVGLEGRPQRPPSVMASSTNDGPQASSQGAPSVAKPGRPVSKFMKERR